MIMFASRAFFLAKRVYTRTYACVPRLTARSFACLSVHIDYRSHETTMDDIKRTFEQAGDVWDVIPLESKMTGLPLKQAIVRFYNGSYQPADSSDAPPVLPPPTEEEIRIVKNAVQDAINRFHRSMLNGVQIYAHHHFDDNPYQLHGWYEEKRRMQMLYSSIKSQQIERFPVSPFRQPLQKGDDYQKGFMEGFKLGMIDGSKEVS